MLGCLAAKFRWRKKMQALGKPTDKPNIVFGTNAHGTHVQRCSGRKKLTLWPTNAQWWSRSSPGTSM